MFSCFFFQASNSGWSNLLAWHFKQDPNCTTRIILLHWKTQLFFCYMLLRVWTKSHKPIYKPIQILLYILNILKLHKGCREPGVDSWGPCGNLDKVHYRDLRDANQPIRHVCGIGRKQQHMEETRGPRRTHRCENRIPQTWTWEINLLTTKALWPPEIWILNINI